MRRGSAASPSRSLQLLERGLDALARLEPPLERRARRWRRRSRPARARGRAAARARTTARAGALARAAPRARRSSSIGAGASTSRGIWRPPAPRSTGRGTSSAPRRRRARRPRSGSPAVPITRPSRTCSTWTSTSPPLPRERRRRRGRRWRSATICWRSTVRSTASIRSRSRAASSKRSAAAASLHPRAQVVERARRERPRRKSAVPRDELARSLAVSTSPQHGAEAALHLVLDAGPPAPRVVLEHAPRCRSAAGRSRRRFESDSCIATLEV